MLVQILFIAPFLLFPLIIAVVMGIMGYRKGWKFGVIGLTAMVAAAGMAYGAAWFLSRVLAGLSFVEDIRWDITLMLRDAGLADLAWQGVYDATLNRLLMLVLLPVLLILIYIIICVIWAILSPKPQPSLKPVGMVCGIFIGVIAGVFGLFAGGVNVVTEAGRAGRAAEIIRPINFDQFDLIHVTDRLPELLDIYFDTELIDASEFARAELLTDAINGVFVESMDNINTMLIIRSSRSRLMQDADNLKELARFADKRRIIANRFGDPFEIDNTKIAENIDELSHYLFNFTFSPELVRILLTQTIRDMSGDPTFIYPIGIVTRDSEAAFAEALAALYSISDFIGGKRFDQMDEAERGDTLDTVNTIRYSPLFPTNVFAYLADILQHGEE
ncbi:MAG: hypothetical protein FWD90_09210 [Defluviitaleaceae bacterium]|nr:hypothetical protein [Defluviitaleaceae bacterium]